MKFKVDRDIVLDAMSHARRAVEARNTIPILGHVMLIADASLTLVTTDLDLELTERVHADIEKPGKTTVPAHTLFDIIRKLPAAAQVSVESTDEERMIVKSGRSRFTLPTLPATDFPTLFTGDIPNRFRVPADDLARLFKTAFAVSTEETRYYLNGVYLHVTSDTKLRAVTSDGHRLACVDAPLPDGAAGMPGVIVPIKVVGQVQRLFTDGEVTVSVSNTKIRFEQGDVRISSKLIDGTFPDYLRAIPAGNNTLLFVEKDVLSAAVDRVATLSTERGKAVKLSLVSGKLTLSVRSPDAGSATDELDVDYEGPPLEIGFNASYLREILGQLDKDKAQIAMSNPGSPAIVKDIDSEGAFYIIMPMRVG